jgi:hypothetical protein
MTVTGVQFLTAVMIRLFIFGTASIPALRPIQPPTQWVPAALAPGVKLPGREDDDSHPYNAEVTNAWSYTFTLINYFLAWCLVKHRDAFAFNL